jgi:hypothetical protein
MYIEKKNLEYFIFRQVTDCAALNNFFFNFRYILTKRLELVNPFVIGRGY